MSVRSRGFRQCCDGGGRRGRSGRGRRGPGRPGGHRIRPPADPSAAGAWVRLIYWTAMEHPDPRNFGAGWKVQKDGADLRKNSMRQLGVALFLAVIFGPSAPLVSARPALRPGDTYYPLAKGAKWTYSTDYADDTELVHEVAGTEKVGTVECFIVEHKTVSPTLGTRMMRKE